MIDAYAAVYPLKSLQERNNYLPRSICLLVLLLAKVSPEPLPVIAVISFHVYCSDFLLDSSAFRCV